MFFLFFFTCNLTSFVMFLKCNFSMFSGWLLWLEQMFPLRSEDQRLSPQERQRMQRKIRKTGRCLAEGLDNMHKNKNPYIFSCTFRYIYKIEKICTYLDLESTGDAQCCISDQNALISCFYFHFCGWSRIYNFKFSFWYRF